MKKLHDKKIEKGKLNKDCKEYQNFLDDIGPKTTQKTYVKGLSKFENWLTDDLKSKIWLAESQIEIQSWNDFVNLPTKKIDEILLEYILYLKNNVNPNSVPNLMAPVKNILIVNHAIFNKDILRKKYPAKTKKGNEHGYTFEQVKSMFAVSVKKLDRALLLFLATAGVRAGAIETIHLRDVEDYEDCKLIKIYPGDVEEYYTFTSKETWDAIQEHLDERKANGENLTSKSLLFRIPNRSAENPDGVVAWNSVYRIIGKLVKNAKIKRERTLQGTRYTTSLVHGLRKFFYSSLGDAGVITVNAEALIGHKTGLPAVYNDATFKRLYENYHNALSYLTFSEDLRKIHQIQKLEKENSELRKEQEFSEMKNNISKLTIMLESIMTKTIGHVQ